MIWGHNLPIDLRAVFDPSLAVMDNIASDGLHSKNQEKEGLGRPGKGHALWKSEPHLILKVDERQRLARERREEREKLVAARESLWLEKEMRARQHYEKHMEERKKRLEEQRLKEERRRAAVDEKRKQKMEEEKERNEAVVRRTQARSQKPKQKNNRWSWGGTLHSNTSISSSDPDRRSISTMNLSKHADPVINKRLSTSSATLLNTPDRGRRPHLSPWETNVVSRLLTPTHSYLARSKSTAALSGDAVIPICPRSASCSPITPQTYKTPANKLKSSLTTSEAIARRRTTHLTGSGEKKEKREDEKESRFLTPNSILRRGKSPSIPRAKSSTALAGSFSPHQKSSVTLSSTSKPASSPSTGSKVGTTPQRPPSPGNVRPIKRDGKKEQSVASVKENTESKDPLSTDVENTKERPNSPTPVTSESVQDPPSLPSTPVTPSTPVMPSPTVSAKPFAGTNNPEEATRILAEKRRVAREQRERDEQEKREKEEEERKKKEELAQRKAEEKAKREEAARQLEEEQKQKEEEQRLEKEKLLRQQELEKEQREREEAERLQKQKEEADRMRLEREKHFLKEEQERSERKKRLEEIMKRTRRSEAGDKQSNGQRNGEVPKTENTDFQDSGFLQSTVEAPRNGEPVSSSPRVVTFQQPLSMESTEKHPNENGLCSPNNNFEEIINLPVGTKPMKIDALNKDGNSIEDLPRNPIIAFEVDNVQTPQTAEVI